MATGKRTSATSRRMTRSRKKKSGIQVIPGVNVTLSWKCLLGITAVKRWFTRKTGIPTTEQGLYNKIGRWIVGLFQKK